MDELLLLKYTTQTGTSCWLTWSHRCFHMKRREYGEIPLHHVPGRTNDPGHSQHKKNKINMGKKSPLQNAIKMNISVIFNNVLIILI